MRTSLLKWTLSQN